MTLVSKIIDLIQFPKVTLGIKDADLLLPYQFRLFQAGIVRGVFKDDFCYSLHGVYELEPKLGDAWMISDKELLRKYGLTAHKSARLVIREAFDKFKFPRIQMDVPQDFHMKWCVSIGFTFEKFINDKARFFILNRN